MLAAFLEVSEISVRQILDMLAHIVLRHLDEEHADPVAYTARAAVQHKPHLIAFIEAALR